MQTTAVSALFWVKRWRTSMYLVQIWCFMLGCIRKTFLQSKRVRAIIGSVFMWGLFQLFGTLSKIWKNTPEWSNALSKQPSMIVTFLTNNTFELVFKIKKWNPAVVGFHWYRIFTLCGWNFADTGMRLGKLIFGGIGRFIANFLVVSRKSVFLWRKVKRLN